MNEEKGTIDLQFINVERLVSIRMPSRDEDVSKTTNIT